MTKACHLKVKEDHSLILIGAVHGDPSGYARAAKLLAHLAPHLVTVEISPFSLRYRGKHGPGWQRQLARVLSQLPAEASRHLAIQRLTAQVALPFEVRAARDYHRLSGTPWRPLDLGGPARRHLPRYGPELLDSANLQTLLQTADGSLDEYVATQFRRARRALAHPPPRLPTSRTPETLRREQFLARRLRALMSRYRRVAHLGGWEHLVAWQDDPCLWRQLADVQPRRLLLDDADQLSP
ncbi:MAG: hypothetical protein P8168_03605 [Deltaproteobacteria bacterium]|jgi:hypothetical protein